MSELFFSLPQDDRGILYDQNSLRDIGLEQEDFVLITLLVGGDYSVNYGQLPTSLPLLTGMHHCRMV